MLAIMTVGAPGAHGATVTGTHGIGVSTPKAAAVAAATIGFEGELHIPNGGMLTMGLLSIMFAAGVPVRTAIDREEQSATMERHQSCTAASHPYKPAVP